MQQKGNKKKNPPLLFKTRRPLSSRPPPAHCHKGDTFFTRTTRTTRAADRCEGRLSNPSRHLNTVHNRFWHLLGRKQRGRRRKNGRVAAVGNFLILRQFPRSTTNTPTVSGPAGTKA